MQSDPIGLEGGENSYLYANGNSLRFMDSLGLSHRDIEKMIRIMHNYVDDLVKRHLRRPGSGELNGWANNFSSTFGSGYLGCLDQTLGLIKILETVTFDDEWKFFDSMPNPVHHRVEAISNNFFVDPVVYLDPWKNEYEY